MFNKEQKERIRLLELEVKELKDFISLIKIDWSKKKVKLRKNAMPKDRRPNTTFYLGVRPLSIEKLREKYKDNYLP